MGRVGVGVRVRVRSGVFVLKKWSTTPEVMIKYFPISVLYPR